jgi:hypothetical protein
MRELAPEERHEMTTALDALTMQLAACVSLYWDEAGTVLVPLHPLLDTLELAPLLETTALTLLHPRSCTLAHGATVLMVPLGEALALLAFSGHFPDALAQVTRIEAFEHGAEEGRRRGRL